MNIFLNNQVQRNRTLLDIMFGRKVQKTIKMCSPEGGTPSP